MTDEIDNNRLTEALDRVARTADGLLLYRYLQKVMMSVVTPSAPKRALPVNEGRRSLAAELMGHMAEGIGENDRACVTFTVRSGGTSTGSSRGAGRRVTIADDERDSELDKLIAEYKFEPIIDAEAP